MASALYFALLFTICLSTSSALFLRSVETADGSYASDVGDTVRSVLDLLTKSQGWTDATVHDEDTDDTSAAAASAALSTTYGVPPQTKAYGSLRFSPAGLLAPHAELLRLIEGFVELKGQIASRLYALVSDNWDLIMGLYRVALNKISGLHSFSLAGLRILRRIVEFAVACISQWQITIPSVSFTGSQEGGEGSYGVPGSSTTDFGSKPYA